MSNRLVADKQIGIRETTSMEGKSIGFNTMFCGEPILLEYRIEPRETGQSGHSIHPRSTSGSSDLGETSTSTTLASADLGAVGLRAPPPTSLDHVSEDSAVLDPEGGRRPEVLECTNQDGDTGGSEEIPARKLRGHSVPNVIFDQSSGFDRRSSGPTPGRRRLTSESDIRQKREIIKRFHDLEAML